MSGELKPCPFCGGPAEIQTEGRVCRMIGCRDCGGSVGAVDLERGYWMWNRRTPAEPTPASTGRAGIQYRAGADDVWHNAPSSELESLVKDGFQVRVVPVAARELDVEADLPPMPKAECLVLGVYAYRDNHMAAYARLAVMADRAARSAAQSTAPVSTEQAGDAWISVQDRLPEPGERVLVTRFAGRVINPGHPGHPGLPWIEVSSIQPGLAIFTCDLCSTGSVTHWKRAQAAPSPNNSPVGADKETK